MLVSNLRSIVVSAGGTPAYEPIWLAGWDAISDGNGGFFVWNASAVETESNDWVKPSNLATTDAGRWQRVLFPPSIGTSAGSMCAGDDVRIPVEQEDLFLATVSKVGFDFQIDPVGQVIVAGNLVVNGTITVFDGTNTKILSVGSGGYGFLTQTSSGSTTAAAQVITMRRAANQATEDPGQITFSGTGASKVFNILAVQDSNGNAPEVVSLTETVFSSDVTDHPVNMPATVTSGNLLLMPFTSDGSPTITTPSGWTLLYSQSNGTVVMGCAFARVATGSEGGTTVNVVTSAAENAAAQVYRISSWQGTLAGVEAGVPGFITTGSTVDIPAFTPSFGQSNTLWMPVLHTSTSQTVIDIGST